jgi:hypothetical protein
MVVPGFASFCCRHRGSPPTGVGLVAQRRRAALALLAAPLAAPGCAAPQVQEVAATPRAGAGAAAVARCVARLWEADGFAVRTAPAGTGWRVEAFGMPPSPRAVGRVPPRLAAEVGVGPGVSVTVRLFRAPTLVGGGREAARVAGCVERPEWSADVTRPPGAAPATVPVAAPNERGPDPLTVPGDTRPDDNPRGCP